MPRKTNDRVAILDVDGSLLDPSCYDDETTKALPVLYPNKPDHRGVINLPALHVLKYQGIRDLYLFTDMNLSKEDIKDRQLLIKKLKSMGFNVLGVVTPKDFGWKFAAEQANRDLMEKFHEELASLSQGKKEQFAEDIVVNTNWRQVSNRISNIRHDLSQALKSKTLDKEKLQIELDNITDTLDAVAKNVATALETSTLTQEEKEHVLEFVESRQHEVQERLLPALQRALNSVAHAVNSQDEKLTSKAMRDVDLIKDRANAQEFLDGHMDPILEKPFRDQLLAKAEYEPIHLALAEAQKTKPGVAYSEAEDSDQYQENTVRGRQTAGLNSIHKDSQQYSHSKGTMFELLKPELIKQGKKYCVYLEDAQACIDATLQANAKTPGNLIVEAVKIPHVTLAERYKKSPRQFYQDLMPIGKYLNLIDKQIGALESGFHPYMKASRAKVAALQELRQDILAAYQQNPKAKILDVINAWERKNNITAKPGQAISHIDLMKLQRVFIFKPSSQKTLERLKETAERDKEVQRTKPRH